MDVTLIGFLVLLVGALVVGFAKTAIGGAASIAVVLFASVLPAKESTGAILPLLVVGDLFAVWAYRRHADWKLLVRLFPSVAVGVGIGAVFVDLVDDVVMRRTIGAALIFLAALHIVRQWRRSRVGIEPPPASATRRLLLATGFGFLAGFTTMVANAGGAAMSIYLFTMGLSVLGFLGTGAWFFLLVNLFKLPFSIGLGLISVDSLRLDLWLVPAVIAGVFLGRWVIRRIDARRFEQLVIGATVASSLYLLR